MNKYLVAFCSIFITIQANSQSIGNISEVEQEGNGNEVFVEQLTPVQSFFPAVSTFTQRGNKNNIQAAIAGPASQLEILQTGNRNFSGAYINGTGSRAALLQVGDENNAEMEIIGNINIVTGNQGISGGGYALQSNLLLTINGRRNTFNFSQNGVRNAILAQQEGNGHFARVGQGDGKIFFFDNPYDSPVLSGDHNTLFLEQAGIENFADAFQTNYDVADLRQDGGYNEVNLQQGNPGGNTISNYSLISQDGFFNESELSQIGSLNSSELSQEGDLHSIEFQQYGESNLSILNQSGYQNSISGSQAGSHETRVSQNGTDNNASVLQY